MENMPVNLFTPKNFSGLSRNILSDPRSYIFRIFVTIPARATRRLDCSADTSRQ